jgi:hypothetical protein
MNNTFTNHDKDNNDRDVAHMIIKNDDLSSRGGGAGGLGATRGGGDE